MFVHIFHTYLKINLRADILQCTLLLSVNLDL